MPPNEKKNTNIHKQSSKSSNVPLKSEERLSFLSSLSSSSPLTKCDPEAIIYKQDFQKNKDALILVLFKLFNKDVFDNKLPADFKIIWNPRLRSSAGITTYEVWTGKNLSIEEMETFYRKTTCVQLATAIVNTAEKLRDTLIHELCHAANWIFNACEGHGNAWKMMANKAMQKFPELPAIQKFHKYEIACKWEYKCTKCPNRFKHHSKLNLKNNSCKFCSSAFKLIVDETKKKKIPRKPSKWNFYIKENYNRVKQDNPTLPRGEIMKLLASKYSITNNN